MKKNILLIGGNKGLGQGIYNYYKNEKYNVFKTTGKPVTVDISLTFAEMELLSNKDAKAPDNYVPSRLEPTVRFKEDAARRLRAAQAHT